MNVFGLVVRLVVEIITAIDEVECHVKKVYNLLVSLYRDSRTIFAKSWYKFFLMGPVCLETNFPHIIYCIIYMLVILLLNKIELTMTLVTSCY